MVVPACAAAIAASAIWAGLRGTCVDRSYVVPDPVTAQVMITSRVMVNGIGWPFLFGTPGGAWRIARMEREG
jgi:hypothetical protein